EAGYGHDRSTGIAVRFGRATPARLCPRKNDSSGRYWMPLTLYAALIPSWLQILNSGRGWLDKAQGSGLAEPEILEAKLAEDMFPFAYQVKSMAAHSQGALEGVRQGVFSPSCREALPQSLDELRQRLDGAISILDSIDEDE